MKKKVSIILTILSAFALASCNAGNNPNQAGKYRGVEDNSIDDVEIPDGLRNEEGGGYTVRHLLENSSGEYDIVAVQELSGETGSKTKAEAIDYNGYVAEAFEQKDILEDGSTLIEIRYKALKYILTFDDIEEDKGILSGSGEFYSYQNRATLIAKPNVGYQFLGWFDGDNLLSEDKTYSFSVEKNLNIVGKFGILPEFSFFEFMSDQVSCTITGLKDGAPLDLLIPEGVTKIGKDALRGSYINSVVLPHTLSEIGESAFYESKVLTLTLNSNPDICNDSFMNCSKLFEIYNNSDLFLETHSYYYGYIAYNAKIVHQANDEPSIIVKYEDFLFTVVNDDPVLVGYSGDDTNLVLPESVSNGNDNYSSYSIGQSALADNKDIEVVTIPSSVTEIGNNAFNGCENLFEVYDLSDSITVSADGSSDNGSLGKYALAVYTSADEPRRVFKTDDFIYYLEVYAPDDIYAYIVKYTSDKKDVVINKIGNYPTGIDSNAFSMNTTIETITLGDGVEYIGEYAFNKCSNLKTVTANYVDFIDDYAFQNCASLTDVSIAKCQEISTNAFYTCYQLRNIDMPSMKNIGSSAFQYCYSLISVTLPSTLESIDTSAFNNCSKLKLVINDSNLSIYTGSSSNGYVGYYAQRITSTQEITQTSDAFYTNTNGFITYMDGSDKHLIAYVGDSKELDVPTDINVIDSGAFIFGDYTSISIGENTALNDSIFYGCKVLEYLDIPCYDSSYLYYLFKGLSSSLMINIPSTLKTLRLSGSVSYRDSSYFSDFDSVENLIMACEFIDPDYDLYDNLTSLKNIYYDGTIEEWCSLSFSDYKYSPMYKASKFYIYDQNGNISLGKNTYSLLEELIIPDTVTSLNDYQFSNFSIKKVVIPDTVTYIGEGVFSYCSDLTDVTYNNLDSISSSLFKNCTSLVEFIIPDTVKYIRSKAFSNCTNLKRINLDNNLLEIESSAFYACSSLVKVTIPASITEISESLFANCYSLQKVNFLGNVTTIGSKAFQNCFTVNDMILPNSVTSIGEAAFKNCETMQEFSFKNLGITEIAPYLFSGCRRLTTVDFSDLITEVGDHAFDNCNKIGLTKYQGGLYFGSDANPYKWLIKIDANITNVEVNGTCEIILGSAFSSASSIKSIIIPNTITKLGQIFEGLNSLQYLEVPFLGETENNQSLNFLFGNTSTTYDYAPSSLRTVKLNGNITSIPANAFSYNSNVTSIIIPDSVTEIGQYAFSYSGIRSFDLKNVETVGMGLFYQCKDLTNVNLGNITSIGNRMFENCSALDEINVSNKISSIGQYAFSNTGLTSIDLSNMADGSVIGEEAFYGCSLLEEAILPNITVISASLFENCSKLTSCEIPSTVTEIGGYAFNSTRLSSVTIPAGINKKIGIMAFANNSALENVTINCTTSDYGYSNAGLFSGSNKIRTVVFGEGATVAFDNLFSGKSALTSVTLPSTLTKIGSSTFSNCSSLTSITIPENVSTIGSNAFNGCSKLLEVYNKSALSLTPGSENNGYVAYYALAIHNNMNEKSIYEKDANGYTFVVKNGKGYLFSYDGDNSNITLPSSFTKNNVTYDTYDIHPNALSYNNIIESITISGSINTIGESAFAGCEKLKNVTIEEGVKVIDDSAFYNCNLLENLSLPNSLEAIYGTSSYGDFEHMNYYLSSTGDRYLGNENNHYLVFTKRGSSGNITIQNGCKIIAPYAANYYTYNYQLILPEGLEFIGNSAFADNKNMSYSITFPSTLKYIDNNAFNNVPKLANISLANTQVEYIGNYAFWADASLNNHTVISLPNTLKHVGEYAFANSLITELIIPANVETISDRAFYNSKNLANLVIKSKGTKIGDWQFYNCSSLQNVYFDGTTEDWATFKFVSEYSTPLYSAQNLYVLDSNGTVSYKGNKYSVINDIILSDNIDEIGNYQFYNFKSKNVLIPKSVTKIGTNAFLNSSSLTNVYYDGTMDDWINIVFTDDKSNPMLYAKNFYMLNASGTVIFNGKNYSVVTDVTIESEIEKLSDYAFYGFSDLTSISLPNTITEIGNYAFSNCANLESITLPASLTKIDNYAFANCIKLSNLVIPNTVTEIGKNAFSFCTSLVDVVLPNAITVIDESTFDKCYNLTNITIPASATTFKKDVFTDCYALQNVYYNGTIADWCNISFANVKSTPMYFAKNFYILDSDGTISYNGNTYKLITELKLNAPATIKSYSFYGFNCLNYLTFESGVTTIGSYAFAECDHLYIVRLGSSITTIGSYAFNSCYRLAEVHSNSSVSLPNPRKTSTTSGNIMQYAYVKYSGSSYDYSMFNLDSDGHIIPENGYLFAKFVSTYGFLIDYVGDDTELVLPSSFTVGSDTISRYGINGYAFYKNTKITKVVLPNNTLSTYDNNGTFYDQIGDSAFEGCSNLTSVIIPSNVSVFGDDVFKDCIRLYEVYNLNTSLALKLNSSSPGSYVSYYAKVIHTSLDEESIIKVDSDGFMYMYLNNIYYLIGYSGDDRDVTVPSSFEFNGNTITNFEIYDKAFREYRSIRSITILDNIESIGSSAFYNCSGLMNVNMPDTITSSNYTYVFSGCYSLTFIKLSSGMTKIPGGYFYYCTNLSSVVIPSSIVQFDYYSFEYSGVNKIFYGGTEAQWNSININSGSGLNSNATIYYYSENAPEEDGYFWHYDISGNVAIWG